MVVPVFASSFVGGKSPESMRDQINLSYSDQLEIICDRDKIQLKKISNQKTVCVYPDSVAKLFERNYLTSIEDHKTFIYFYNNDLKVGEEFTLFGQILDSRKNNFALSMVDFKNIQLSEVDLVDLDDNGKFVFTKKIIDKVNHPGVQTLVITYDSEIIKMPIQVVN